ncbi:hypothetical protein BDF20DRAFT_887072 [Mycotypha africana]|uniref:uncharacterized protein n=1 Tax=Mycotypha africana TaxID=64632 RepID=UPI002300A007|nr:uncharacterized protein BDF20DRAFT_887072 [Mycotypha africana]KAI8971892.1 hypothetical protein BDF20DRAFT_887072 [Mycotypha africana]
MTRIISSTNLLPRSASSPLIYNNPGFNTSIVDSPKYEKLNRECILFPTYASRDPKDPSKWITKVRGWALSHNCSTAKQKMMMSITKSVAGKSSVDRKSSLLFEQRFKYFLATNKRYKPFLIQPIGITITANDISKSNDINSDRESSAPWKRQNTKDSSKMEVDEDHYELIPGNDAYYYTYTPPASSTSSCEGGDDDEDGFWLTTSLSNAINKDSSTLSAFVSPHQERPTNPISTVLDRNSNSQIDNLLLSYQQSLQPLPLVIQHQQITDPTMLSSPTTLSTATSVDEPLTPKSKTKIPFFSGTAKNNDDQQEDESFLLGTELKTQASGFLSGRLTIPHDKILQWAQVHQQCDTRLIYLQSICVDNSQNNSRMTAKKGRQNNKLFTTNHGIVNLVEPIGISVISDIDDTIKITEILSGARTVLSKTFFETPLDVPGMADVYMAWYTQGAAFHYVSNSPFQLMPMLENFLSDNQFPPGSVHLRDDGKLISRLVETPGQAKHNTIKKIMMDFPLRQFILIGDSGEIDLEVYTRIALEHPEQVLKIYIRDVTTPNFIKKKKEKNSQTASQPQKQPLSKESNSLQHEQQASRKNNSSITSLLLNQRRRFSSQSTPTPLSRIDDAPMNKTDTNNSSDSNDSNNSLASSNYSPPISTSIAKKTARRFGSPLRLRKAVVNTITEYAIEPRLTGHRSTNQSTDCRTEINDTIVTASNSSDSYVEEDAYMRQQQNTSAELSNDKHQSNKIGASEACNQLFQRVEKAKAKLSSYSIDVILFEDAQVLQNDTNVQSALWSYWDVQYCE